MPDDGVAMTDDKNFDDPVLSKLEKLIFNLTEENFQATTQDTMKIFDSNLPNTCNIITCKLVYNAFSSQRNTCDIYLNFLKTLQKKYDEINQNIGKLISIFIKYISKIKTQESYYMIARMIEQNLIDANITKNIKSIYFANYKTEKEIKDKHYNDPFKDAFLKNYEELSKNNWELHKQLIKEGHNPNDISKIIRNDEIEKLQEISSQTKFDFNQTIEPSLYERCTFINKENVTLIDYAAFFSAVKCFKYLLMNNAKVISTGKYAVAGGNEEIIHLCEQNHSTFEGACEAAIMFHQNDIFKYIYENKLEKTQSISKMFEDKNNDLVSFCIKKDNYEILSFLIEEGIKVNNNIINEAARNGNLCLVKYFLQNKQIPKDILFFASETDNIELVKYILDKEGINVNAKRIFLNNLKYVLIIWNMF